MMKKIISAGILLLLICAAALSENAPYTARSGAGFSAKTGMADITLPAAQLAYFHENLSFADAETIAAFMAAQDLLVLRDADDPDAGISLSSRPCGSANNHMLLLFREAFALTLVRDAGASEATPYDALIECGGRSFLRVDAALNGEPVRFYAVIENKKLYSFLFRGDFNDLEVLSSFHAK